MSTWEYVNDAALTVQYGSNPVEDRSPEVYPANKVQVVRGVGLLLKNVIDSLVKDGDGAWA